MSEMTGDYLLEILVVCLHGVNKEMAMDRMYVFMGNYIAWYIDSSQWTHLIQPLQVMVM